MTKFIEKHENLDKKKIGQHIKNNVTNVTI